MKKDRRKALQFFLAAANQDHPDAMFAAAQLYEKSYEFKPAIKWYEAAKAKGNTKAEERLKVLEKLK